MELLCEQADVGHMSLEYITRILSNKLSIWRPIWDSICKKFNEDEDGLYYNEILEGHLIKRRYYTESRKNNLKGSHMATHMVNVNEDVNISVVKKKLEERMTEFELEVSLYKGVFPEKMLKEFYNYWSEPNPSKTKMKKELQKTWDTKRRLNTWNSNQEKFGVKKDGIYAKHITEDKLKRVAEDIANDPDLKR
jgi:hypothetical protein